ncbi:MAG: cytochrome c3 family protein, partial [Planctomycetota bacterium]
MSTRAAFCAAFLVLGGLTATVAGQGQGIVDTKHNLSAIGPGAVRAATDQEVCVFCHTPHGASPVQPLWNRQLPVSPYNIYTSSALDAELGQPTGASKLCLSCHDGTIALGSIVSRNQVIGMSGGITTLPPGTANLGTDLSDDHPISFRYDSSLAARDLRLRDPHTLPTRVRLDANRELQCTTCHDAHDDTYGDFLVMDNADAALCTSCHQIDDTTVWAHASCSTCHRPHTAPSGPFLLVDETVSTTCLSCHDGSNSRAGDVASDLLKVSNHDTGSPIDPPDPEPAHATCASCHEPHTMSTGSARPPGAAPSLGKVAGVSTVGASLATTSFEYQVCFRCHGDGAVTIPLWISRQIVQDNTRLEFDASAVSFHPVTAAGRNPDVPSLKPPWTESSIVLCSDCHGSDTSRKAGGSGPNGVHGSNERPLLLARYDTIDLTPESNLAYALCYRCHDRDGFDGILQDRSFPHRLHVVEQAAPCSICHDAHGISSAQGTRLRNSHLINFDTRVVFPDPVTGRLEFEDQGVFRGSCTLMCHGDR